jgi:hypothetical protein
MRLRHPLERTKKASRTSVRPACQRRERHVPHDLRRPQIRKHLEEDETGDFSGRTSGACAAR